ncbi:MAG: hypothetical protein J7515_04530 [Caulobacter sp.]|nr:hypothetical protein [Caulobacter sp.]
MPATRPSRRRLEPAAGRWLLVGGASLVFHGLLGWALLVAVPAPPLLLEPRTVVVQLLTPERPHLAEHAAVRPQPAPLRVPTPRTPSTAPPVLTPSPRPTAPGAPGVIVAPPGFTARGTLTGGGEALREAARESGCTEADIVHLTKAERDACNETLGAKHKNGPALYAAIDPDKKAAFDGDCKKDDDWCLYRTGKGPYPGLFALMRGKKPSKGWD